MARRDGEAAARNITVVFEGRQPSHPQQRRAEPVRCGLRGWLVLSALTEARTRKLAQDSETCIHLVLSGSRICLASLQARTGSKAFFFEKKKQKAFICAVADRGGVCFFGEGPTEPEAFWFFQSRLSLLRNLNSNVRATAECFYVERTNGFPFRSISCRRSADIGSPRQRSKSFLLLFLEKEGLASSREHLQSQNGEARVNRPQASCTLAAARRPRAAPNPCTTPAAKARSAPPASWAIR